MYAAKDLSLTFRKARELGIPVKAAADMRRRYLLPRLGLLILDGSPIALFWADEVLKELDYLGRHSVELPAEQVNTRLDERLIEQARNVPASEVVHFVKGKAVAWCHPDTNPSLTFLSRTGRAWCPVCERKFSAIDILMDRDNFTFTEAVKRLAA